MMRYYLDTEFNGFGGELISLALVEQNNGQELYLVNDEIHHDDCCPWVQENVLPVIWAVGTFPNTLPLRFIGEAIYEFLKDDDAPYIMVDWPDDIRYFCKCLMHGPGEMVNLRRLTFDMVRCEPRMLRGAVRHNALWDARQLRFTMEW